MKEDAIAWCREGRNIPVRLPLLAYGTFLLWKIAFDPKLFSPVDFLDLAIHELGHIIFMPFGQWLGVAGGSITQLMAPIYGGWQFLRQRDYFAAAFSLAWLGESLSNLSVYIGDASRQELPLVNLFGGEPIHDWGYLLDSVNRLSSDVSYSLKVRFIAFLFALAFLWIGSWLIWKMWEARAKL